MDLNDAVVTCAVALEWSNCGGVTGRKLNYRSATLRLIRNDLRDMFIEISNEGKMKPIKIKLKDILVHKKFMSEGKASIQFKAEKCSMMLSNAPPSSLINFLKIMFFKLTNSDTNESEAIVQKNIRSHLLSSKPSNFEEISPVTTAEMIKARKIAGLSKSSATTPSPPQAKKRRFEELKSQNGNSAKRLYATSPLADNENIQLNDEQKQILQACISGKNIFFTGSAGTGKSFLLKKIISALPPDTTTACASTGVAACLIGGITIHSFAGIGTGEAGLNACIGMASRSNSGQTWRKCKTLIIDEVSMIDGDFFEKMEQVARHMRKNEKPFGGIQLILCGDFFQLPPVGKKQLNLQNSKKFCFQSKVWESCIQIVYELKQVHRQTDPEFVKILNHIRIGYVNDDIVNRLKATEDQEIETNGILATQLCSHTKDSQLMNESKLEALPGEAFLFQAEDSDDTMTKQLDNQVRAASKIYLKLGAQVMLLKNINISAGLVNGARGVVIRFENSMPVVRFKNNQEYLCKSEKWTVKNSFGALITRKQIPLQLAWAFSIHKSQGLTLDCVEMCLSRVFEAGQAYVALSRAKSLNSIRILSFNKKQVWANPHVLQFYKTFRRRLHDMTLIPLGEKKSNVRKDPKVAALDKIKKSLMNKPLVTIS